MKNCNCDSAINRDGSGQLQRYLKALDPSYAPIDGRSKEDLLVFAKKYAGQIRFYDIPESKIEDPTPIAKISWREFFRRDMAVIAASIAVTDAAGFKKEFDEINERLQVNTTPEIYGALYAPITGMLKKIDRWLTVAIPENPLYADLKLAIDSDLKEQVQKIMAYEEGFKFVDPTVDLKINLDGVENEAAWGLLETVPPDASIYKGTTKEERILHASLFTEDIFHAFYNFLNRLISDSAKYIQFALEQYPSHQPHMALFITFLQLFNKAQQQMNGLTGRMLDYYYKEVLHLQTKGSVPDKVHIVFELAKDVLEYDLASGTSLKAGPDNSGMEQVYKTGTDLVINQAKVKELKTVFVEKIQKGTTAASLSINSIYARPVANSADGFGEKFTGTDTKWPTFGLGSPDKAKPTNACDKIDYLQQIINRKDQASIGFAIASPQLVMQGGKRLIQIKLNNSAASLFARQEKMTAANGGNLFEFSFTGDKEWFTVNKVMTAANQQRFTKFFPVNTFNPASDDIEASYYFTKETDPATNIISYILSVYLPPAAQSVLGYNAKIHSAFSYGTLQPVMQVKLNSEIDINATDYKKLSVSSLSLKVKVGSILPNNDEYDNFLNELKAQGKQITFEEMYYLDRFPADGLSKLVLQNETAGLLAAGKPFDPFSAYPNKGKSFYIGSDEVFNKPLGQMAITLKNTMDDEFVELPSSSDATDLFNSDGGDYAVSILENRGWVDLRTKFGSKYFQVTLKTNILYTPKFFGDDDEPTFIPHIHKRLPILPAAEWKSDTEKGFLRLTNLKPVPTGKSFLEGSQDLAHELELKEVSLSYASELVKLEVGVDEFYHVYPFGTIETFINTTATAAASTSGSTISTNTITKIRSFLGNSAFANMDEQRNFLLVNADNSLLPQFTYLSPYDQYNSGTLAATAATGLAPGKSSYKKDGDALAEQLMLSASGLTAQITGGSNQYSGLEQEEGMLFIGIEKTQPLQMVSMLFQFAEGSAGDEDNDPPDIHWSYLTNNEWRPLKDESLVSDGTAGFQTTGIIKIEIPPDATSNNTIITGGLYWLCASITTNSNRIPMLIDVVTQAVLANFEDNNNDQSHFDEALAAGSISKLSVAVAEVGKVVQPFASYDGKHREIGKEFYTRVSERLRHKARAITAWDYEHLVLDRFPSIYKVKCITHTDPNCLCRQPEIRAAAAPVPVKIDCGIGNIDLKYLENNVQFVSEQSAKDLLNIIDKLKTGKDCKITVTGFAAKDDTRSMAINNNRLEAVVKTLLDNGIDQTRFTKTLLQTGEKDLVSIAEVPVFITPPPAPIANAATVCCGPQIAPGHVLMIPISNLKNRNAVNPLQPKTSRRVLLDIQAYLQKRVSPFVHIYAKNPVYEQILTFFRVKFREGYDKGFYMKKLNDEIVHYLTPWAFDDTTDVVFGQKIYASSIINFIEERVYVDFITDFLMIVCRHGCCDDVVVPVTPNDGKDVLNSIAGCSDMEMLLQDETNFLGDIVAKPSTARSLLVSVKQHIIIPYIAPVIISPCMSRKIKGSVAGTYIETAKVKEITEIKIKPVVVRKPVPLVDVVKATKDSAATPETMPSNELVVKDEAAKPLTEKIADMKPGRAVKNIIASKTVKKTAPKNEPAAPLDKTKTPKRK